MQRDMVWVALRHEIDYRDQVVEGESVVGMAVQKRSVAMVYQLFINYPSLTVYDNIDSPLKIGGLSKPEDRAAVIAYLHTLK